MRWQAFAIGSLLALACGNGVRDGSSRSATSGDPGGPEGNDNPVPCNDKLAVRFAGVKASAQQQLVLKLAEISLQGRSGALTADFTRSGELSLPGDDRLVLMKMPSGEVDVTVRLDHVGMCTGGTCTDLTLCGSPIQFQFDPAKVSPDRCHVVLHLDVANSVQGGPDGALVFQPRLSVHY